MDQTLAALTLHRLQRRALVQCCDTGVIGGERDDGGDHLGRSRPGRGDGQKNQELACRVQRRPRRWASPAWLDWTSLPAFVRHDIGSPRSELWASKRPCRFLSVLIVGFGELERWSPSH